MPSRPPPSPPRTTSSALAGRYVLGEVIGVGGMGTVHLAWDLRARQEVAVKVLRRPDCPSGAGEPLARFVREQALRISHPHVLAPHGWAADDDVVLLVMQVVAGGSLEPMVRHGPLPERFVVVILAQLLEALAAVHSSGVVHRDVKPANLLLEPTGTGRPHLLLGDFGVAAATRDGVTRGGVGTDGYLAPELVAGVAPEPRHDLYAVGVVAQRALGLGSPAGPGHRPSGMDAWVAALLAADPDRRPASALEALALLPAHGDVDAPWDPRGMPDVGDVVHATGTVTGVGPDHARPHRDARAGRLALASSVCLVGSAVLSVAACGAWLARAWPGWG